MKVRDLAIDGFGVWTGLELANLDDGLNVFYGPNEAGKTTLMQFLRAMLYGFSADRRQRYLPPVHGGQPGGRVTVASADGQFSIRRHATAADSPVGRLECLADGELIRDERLLGRLMGNVDEAVFRNVFAIGLREIQELGALSDTDAAQWLYKLAVGGDRVSLVDLLSTLKNARERLLAPGEAPSTIVQLLAERDAVRRDAGDQAQLRQYVELGRKRRELVAQLENWERDAQAGERSARLVETASAVSARWHNRQTLEADLAAARRTPAIQPQTLAEFEDLEQRLARAKRRQKALSRRLAESESEIESLGLHEALWRRATTIEALLAEEQWITALDAERLAWIDKVKGLEARRTELCTRLGFDPALSVNEPGDGMSKAWRQLKPLAESLREARAKLASLSQEAETGQQGVQTADRELVAALKARGADSLSPLLERSGQLVSQLRRRVQLEDRLAELARRKTELEARSQEFLANALLPGWAVVGVGAVFASGIAGVLAGAFLPSSLVGGARLLMCGVGAIAVGGAAAAKGIFEQALQQRSATCLSQLVTLGGQIDEAGDERDALDQQLPRGGGPLVTRLQAAEKEQAAIEALVPLESKRQAANQDSETAEQRREEAHQAYVQLRHRWRQALVAAGLSPKTSPGRAGQLTHVRRHLGRFDAQLNEARGQLARRQSVVEAFAHRLAQLQAELDLRPTEPTPQPTPATSARPTTPAAPAARVPAPDVSESSISLEGLAEALRTLREQLHEQMALAARRKSLLRAGKRLHARRHKVRGQARRLERKLAAVLLREEALDAAELRHRAEQLARGDQLAAARDAATLEIHGLIGPGIDDAEVATLVASGSKEQLDQRWLDLTGRVRQWREEINRGHEQLGRWDEERRSLVADQKGSQMRLRLATIDQQLHDAQERWQVLTTAQWLLAGVRKRYERERQPETLREASGYLERLTEGRYRRVWTPLDQDVLRVDDAHGESLPVDVLSRGTREQLFLGLRLALVRWFARRGIDLPLVLDDVLVNFDARRARAAAALLQDFASRGHQLLVFTCHEHMYQLFRSLGASSRQLPANPRAAAWGGEIPADPPLVAELDVPQAPIVLPPPPPAPPRPAAVEIVEPAPPQPTNGHAHEEVVETPPEPPAPPPPPPKPARRKANVKFDCTHGPRGPFATALWHERVTYEMSGDAEQDDQLPQPDDDWTDINGVD